MMQQKRTARHAKRRTGKSPANKKVIAVLLVFAMLLTFVPSTWASSDASSPAGDANVSAEAETAADIEADTEAAPAIDTFAMEEGESEDVSTPSAIEWNETNAPVVESGEYSDVNGIGYKFVLDSNTKTAKVRGVENPSEPTAIEIPGYVSDSEGTIYTVTEWAVNFFADDCPNVTGVTLPDTLQKSSGSYKIFSDITEIEIPGSVKLFTSDFQYCTNLQKIVFAEGVEEIGSNTMLKNANNVSEIVLPQSLKKISGIAIFKDAVALEEIDFPDQVEIDTSSLFSGCTALRRVTLPATVTEISDEAFKGCSLLESVTAKGTITSIGESAFRECISLQEIPDLSQVETMGDQAFSGCFVLAGEVNLSSLKTIPTKAFSGTGITSVVFSEELTEIGACAFQQCYSLTELAAFPETLTTIKQYAFENCQELSEPITIPDSVGSLGDHAFFNTAVTEFYVGRGIWILQQDSFPAGTKKITVNNSEDNVYFTQRFPKDAVIDYKFPSVKKAGETISSVAGAPNLQEAVDAAPAGEPTTITIEKYVAISKALTIPEGKDIIIRADNPDEAYSISGNGKDKLQELIHVENGASVTFDGNVTLSGRYNSGSVIDNEGTVTLTGDAVVSSSNLNSSADTGVIDNRGDGATFIMRGGRIEENVIGGGAADMQCCGVVRVSDGAAFMMEGGVIQNNEIIGGNNFNTSAGVLLYGRSSGEMTGGTIRGNEGLRGSAIMLYNLEGTAEANKTTFTLSGGDIKENIGKNGTLKGSGAVHIEGNALFTMKGGTICDNIGVQGAGVCVVDPYLSELSGEYPTSTADEYKTAFVMNGGTISGNKGANGGGIYSFSNGVQLNAGTICDNTASILGGGIYSEGNAKAYSTLHMENARITKNTADSQGGGLWFCPTGSGAVYVQNGGMILENTAGEAGDDVVFAKGQKATNEKSQITLANRMPGGGAVWWYQDGGIYMLPGSNLYPSVNRDIKRYAAQASEERTRSEYADCENSLALKAVAVEAAAVSLAESKTKLIITGNSAEYGGGVGANGGIVIGQPDKLKEIPVKKIWNHGNNPENAQPKSITVKLLVGETVIDKLILDGTEKDETGNWIGVFKDLPIQDEAETDIVYTVQEEAVTQYKTELTEEKTTDETTKETVTTVVITNTYIPKVGSLEVVKTVSGAGSDINKAFPFTVTLSDTAINGVYGDLTFEHGVASFTLKHNERKKANNLPEGISYEVTELDNGGYTMTATGEKGEIVEGETKQASFYNHKDKPSGGDPGNPPPETPNHPEEPKYPEDPKHPEEPNEPLIVQPGNPEEEIPDDGIPLEGLDTPQPGDTPQSNGTPQTGDTTPWLLLVGLLGLSACGLAITMRKKN